ncbi:cobalt-precorrin-6A reductase [Actinoplanes sp. CA-030573]|uniref:cobalt-precorrin-6A reductase n=1 Tax=Actinoplanes sp. CA-030573 TaxID=3239898 RepID=UPI003D94D626
MTASPPPSPPGTTEESGTPDGTVLILGGTTEARALAGALTGFAVITSLAGRTSSPLLPAGEVRIGGFGGAEGLTGFLRERRIDILIDATHPFAARISANAAVAAGAAGIPLLVLRRPGWTERPGDDWRRVPDLDAAAAALPEAGRRVFLTTGRQGLAAFAHLDECWFLARSVEPPAGPRPRNLDVLLDRGPFTLDGELRVMRDHRIDVLVSKDSGGSTAKLDAARTLGIPVVLVERPPGTATATTVEELLKVIETLR